jgi:hypothetical protein
MLEKDIDKLEVGDVLYYGQKNILSISPIHGKGQVIILYGDKYTVSSHNKTTGKITLSSDLGKDLELNVRASYYHSTVLRNFSIHPPIIPLRDFDVNKVKEHFISKFPSNEKMDYTSNHHILSTYNSDDIEKSSILDEQVESNGCGDWFYEELIEGGFDDKSIFVLVRKVDIYNEAILMNYIEGFCTPFLKSIGSLVNIRRVTKVNKCLDDYIVFSLDTTSESGNVAMNMMFCMSLVRSSYIDWNSIPLSYYLLSPIASYLHSTNFVAGLMAHGNFLSHYCVRSGGYPYSHFPHWGGLGVIKELDLLKSLKGLIRDNDEERPDISSEISYYMNEPKVVNIFEDNFYKKLIDGALLGFDDKNHLSYVDIKNLFCFSKNNLKVLNNFYNEAK